MQKLILFFSLVFIFSSCASQKRNTGKTIKGLTFLGEYSLPHKLQFNGTTVGGLSGIEYVPSEDVYHLVSDDRSDIDPARFYTARIAFGQKGIDSVKLLSVTTLLQQNGRPFPGKKQDSLRVPDPEALRYHGKTGNMVWSSEGERIARNKKNNILIHPFIAVMGTDGKLTDTFPLPSNAYMTAIEKGPRQNGVFEGLSFADNYKTLYVSFEEPLYEDGQRAGLDGTTGWIRIVKYDVATKQPVAQYAYQIDPVVQEPISRGAFVINGVPDILALNRHQLLVTERSYSTGRLGCNVRVYLADLKGAENIAGVPSLQKHQLRNPVKKKLLLNMDHLRRWIDNVEGATFGPLLPNGKRSLLFVTDDNFSQQGRTQFLLFEVD